MKKLAVIFGLFCLPLLGFSNVDSLRLPIILGEVNYASVFDTERQLVATLFNNKDAAKKLSKLPDGNYLLVKSDATLVYSGDFRVVMKDGKIVEFLSLPDRVFNCKPPSQKPNPTMPKKQTPDD